MIFKTEEEEKNKGFEYKTKILFALFLKIYIHLFL